MRIGDAEYYIDNEIENYHPTDQPWFDEDGNYDGKSIIILNAIRQAQRDVVEVALRIASERAECEKELGNMYDPNSGYYIVNKNSILSLKEELLKQINGE